LHWWFETIGLRQVGILLKSSKAKKMRTYIYIAIVREDRTGKETMLKGDVTLLR
jgi:hypothetical protein